MFDVWTEPSEVRHDRFIVVGVQAELARQREQLQRILERHARFGHARLQRRTLRFLGLRGAFLLARRLGRLAKLHVRAIATGHQVDVLTRRRIHAERARALGLRAHQFQRLLDREIRRRDVFGQRSRTSPTAFTELHERAEAPDPHAY